MYYMDILIPSLNILRQRWSNWVGWSVFQEQEKTKWEEKNITQTSVKCSFFFGWKNKKFISVTSTNVGCHHFLSGELLWTSNQLGLLLPEDQTLEYLLKRLKNGKNAECVQPLRKLQVVGLQLKMCHCGFVI